MGILDSLRQRWQDREDRLKEEKQRRYDQSMRELEHQKIPLEREASPKRNETPLERLAPALAERAKQAAYDREHAPEDVRGITAPEDYEYGHLPPGTAPGPSIGAGKVVRVTKRQANTAERPVDPLETLNAREAMKPGAIPHERLAGILDGRSPSETAGARVRTASLLQQHRDEAARHRTQERKL